MENSDDLFGEPLKTVVKAAVRKRRGGRRPGAGRPKGSVAKVPGKNGGARPGSGRKKGKLSPATIMRARIVERAVLDAKTTPLEVMLKAMHAALEANDLDLAHNYAKDAAPYVHAKLAAVNHSGSLTVKSAELSDDALAAIAFGSGKGADPTAPHSTVTH